MRYPDPLIPGRLIKRYKRFLADVKLDGGAEVTAHCANSGSMLGLAEPGARVWLSPAANPKRKLKYTWEIVEADGAMVGINTFLPNRLASEAIGAGAIPELVGYDELRREVPYGRNSRIDLLLQGPGRPSCYVELKSVTLKRGRAAQFPDAVTARGAKHLDEMAREVAGGARAVMFYLVQRADCDEFSIARDIDPDYDGALGRALAAGVEVICHACRVTTEGIDVAQPVTRLID
jgi:sugar fermentation stimulation protein A